MEISLTYYFTILCVTTFLHLEAKPFSLNQAIAENLKRKHFVTLPDISTEDYSSSENTIGSSLATKKLKDLRTLLGKANIKLPVLNYNKKLQFKKPTKLEVNNKKLHFKKPTKLEVKPKHNQKQGIKRQVEDDYGINKKYLPLLRSISMLFDDILSPDNVSGESESFISNRGEFACTCSRKSKDLQPSQSRPQKKTIVAPETVPTEASPPIETVTPAEKVYHITPSSKRSFRQNKILPILFPRNTTSNRGNYNGLRKRGSPARLGNIARNISRNRGNSKYDSRKRKDKAIPANDQENPNGDSRDNASFKFGRGISRNGTRGGDPAPTEVTEVTESAKSESTENTRGPLSELERENSVEIGGDQTESPVYAGGDETKGPIYVPRLGRRSRGFTTKNKESNSKKSLQSKKYSEKSFDNVALNNASVERKLIRSSGSAEKDQIISSTDAPARVTRDILVPYSVTETSPRNKSAIVMIIDGYSIARDKNGKSTLSKQHFNDGI